MNRIALGLLTVAAGLLGACSLPSPSLSLLASDCGGQFGAPGDVAPSDVFFMASNMADCREDSLQFAIFRCPTASSHRPTTVKSHRTRTAPSCWPKTNGWPR